jgi:hypothetical protein
LSTTNGDPGTRGDGDADGDGATAVVSTGDELGATDDAPDANDVPADGDELTDEADEADEADWPRSESSAEPDVHPAIASTPASTTMNWRDTTTMVSPVADDG